MLKTPNPRSLLIILPIWFALSASYCIIYESHRVRADFPTTISTSGVRLSDIRIILHDGSSLEGIENKYSMLDEIFPRQIYMKLVERGFGVEMKALSPGFIRQENADLFVIVSKDQGPSSNRILSEVSGFACLFTLGLIPSYTQWESRTAAFIFDSSTSKSGEIRISTMYDRYHGWIPLLIGLPRAETQGFVSDYWWRVKADRGTTRENSDTLADAIASAAIASHRQRSNLLN